MLVCSEDTLVRSPVYAGFLGDTVVKNLPAKAAGADLLPESGRSLSVGDGNPL